MYQQSLHPRLCCRQGIANAKNQVSFICNTRQEVVYLRISLALQKVAIIIQMRDVTNQKHIKTPKFTATAGSVSFTRILANYKPCRHQYSQVKSTPCRRNTFILFIFAMQSTYRDSIILRSNQSTLVPIRGVCSYFNF